MVPNLFGGAWDDPVVDGAAGKEKSRAFCGIPKMKEFSLGEVLADSSQLVDELTYSNYCYNRVLSPDITPERWERVYGPASKDMEERFQKESGK